ncbi:MAG: PGPGW domain-containing protein [Myxococcota bacterium]|nr:PGPGW domain-containing protein [Myxococcota bacterium]
MAAIAGLKHEWRLFKRDAPGERFANHRKRMKEQPRWLTVVRATAGVALIGVGIVFMVLPGPGLLGVVFGLALLAGISTKLSHLMDRTEPPLRAAFQRAHAWWTARSTGAKAALIAVTAVLLAVAACLAWTYYLGPKLTG